MASDERWIRLNAHWSTSEWLENLQWCARAVWPEFLCAVKRGGIRGRIRVRSVSRLAGELDIPKEFVEEMLTAAIESGAVVIEDRHWVVVKWTQYQPKDSTERSQDFRSRKAEEAQNAENSADSEDSQVQTQRECNAVQRKRNAVQRDATISSVARDDLTKDEGRRTTDDRRGTSQDQDLGQARTSSGGGMAEPPTVEMVRLRFQHHHGLDEGAARTQSLKFWNFHEGRGWTIKGKPMFSWTSAVATWARNLSDDEKVTRKELDPDKFWPNGVRKYDKHGARYSETGAVISFPDDVVETRQKPQKTASDDATPVQLPESTQNASAGQTGGKKRQTS